MTKSVCRIIRIVSLAVCLTYLRSAYDIGIIAYIGVILVAFAWGLTEYWEGLGK